MELGKCISMLINATTDNEKMAALMIVAKLIKADDIGAEGRRKVLDAVGFNFLNRLLATASVPEDCHGNPYHTIALTILACICTDEELVKHPQVTAKIPFFNECLLQSHSSGKSESLSEDALQCLQGISGSCSGLKHVLRPGYCTLETLAGCYLQQSKVSEEAMELLLYIVGQLERSSVATFSTSVTASLVVLTSEFKINQDELKFKLCEKLNRILTQCGDLLDPGDNSWLTDIVLGLKDILTSKLDSAHRNPSLHLAAALCRLFGLEWTLTLGTQFLVLLVNLFSVETRLAIEEKELDDIISSQSSNLLCSCFVVLETAVVYVSKQTDLGPTGALSRETLLQLHSTLTEAFSFVILLLSLLESQDPPATDIHRAEELSLNPLLPACVRVVGAWLAEDSLSLPSEVYSCLPLLVQSAKSTDNEMAESKNVDLLKFILPGLSHLTAEDKPRRIMLKAGLLELLLGHLQRLLDGGSLSVDKLGRMKQCCEVMVNVCVCEPKLLKEEDVLVSHTSLIFKIFSEVPVSSKVLKMNALLILTLITNKKGSECICKHITETPMSHVWNLILQYLVSCLEESPAVNRKREGLHLENTSQNSETLQATPPKETWEDISELWLIIMDVMAQLAGWDHQLVQVMAEKDYVRQLTNILATLSQNKWGNEQLDSIATAVCTLSDIISHSLPQHN